MGSLKLELTLTFTLSPSYHETDSLKASLETIAYTRDIFVFVGLCLVAMASAFVARSGGYSWSLPSPLTVFCEEVGSVSGSWDLYNFSSWVIPQHMTIMTISCSVLVVEKE